MNFSHDDVGAMVDAYGRRTMQTRKNEPVRIIKQMEQAENLINVVKTHNLSLLREYFGNINHLMTNLIFKSGESRR